MEKALVIKGPWGSAYIEETSHEGLANTIVSHGEIKACLFFEETSVACQIRLVFLDLSKACFCLRRLEVEVIFLIEAVHYARLQGCDA